MSREVEFEAIEAAIMRVLGAVADLTADVRDLASVVRDQRRRMDDMSTGVQDAFRIVLDGSWLPREVLRDWLDASVARRARKVN
jgi:hypothetical protein